MVKKALFLQVLLASLVSFHAYGQAGCESILAGLVDSDSMPGVIQKADEPGRSLLPDTLFKDLPEDFAVADIDPSDMQYLTHLTKKITGRNDLNETNVFGGLVRAKREYEAKINSNGVFIGQRVNETTRNMRKRRDEFELFIKSKDSSGAAAVYRSLWESFYVSKSALLKYTRNTKSDEQKAEFVLEMKETLLGLTEAPHLKKVKKRVHALYGVGSLGAVKHFLGGSREADINDVLEVLDTIYAFSRSEFMFANHRVREMLESPDTSDSVKRTVESFVGYMNPDNSSERFRMGLLSKNELESYQTAEELFRLRPQTLVLWLKHVSEVESWRTPALLLRAGVQEILIKITDFLVNDKLKEVVRRLIMLDYNTYVIDKHIERISSVISSSPVDQVDVFVQVLGQGTAETQSQFLQTFARLSEDVVVWNRIKKHFNDLSKEENTSRIIVERMSEAEKYISTYGYLSRTHRVSALDLTVGATIRLTTLATLTLNFDRLIAFGNSFLATFN